MLREIDQQSEQAQLRKLLNEFDALAYDRVEPTRPQSPIHDQPFHVCIRGDFGLANIIWALVSDNTTFANRPYKTYVLDKSIRNPSASSYIRLCRDVPEAE